MLKAIFIFPCFNEEEILSDSYHIIDRNLRNLIQKNIITEDSKICFVDDGSSDKTWNILESFSGKSIISIKLSKNFGHQMALYAALSVLADKFDAYITLDVDLQDDISVSEEMLIKASKGADVVYGVRSNRVSDSFFKRTSAHFFYKLMEILGVNFVYNHADFRLITNRVLNVLLDFKEVHLFLRGIIPLIGFRQEKVYYTRKERIKGKSKYSLRKMLSFAWNGISSFSIKPLKIISMIGGISILISAGLIFWGSIQIIRGETVTGWFSLLAVIVFFGGVTSLSLGIIGEYIGKIFIQVKNRPKFVIEKISGNDF